MKKLLKYLVASVALALVCTVQTGESKFLTTVQAEGGGYSADSAEEFSIGDTVEPYFEEKAQKVYYQFTTEESEDYWYIFERSTPQSEVVYVRYQIYDSEMQSVFESYIDENDAVAVKLSGDSVYYLEVEGRSGESFPGNGIIKTSAEFDDAGDTEDNAKVIASGKKYDMRIDAPKDVDVFEFKAGAPSTRIRLTTKMDVYLRWEIFDEDGVRVKNLNDINELIKGDICDKVADTEIGKRYYIHVYSIRGDTTGEYSITVDSGSAAVKVPKAVSIKNVKSSRRQATVTFNSVENADGYEIMYATDRSFNNGKKTTTTTAKTKTILSLSSGKTYYFKVRGYVNTSSGKKYGVYGSVKSVKVK